MCMDAMKSAQDDAPPTTPQSVMQAGAAGMGGGATPRAGSGISKTVNNPILQGGSAAAGAALAPATMGLSLLLPVATKLLGGLLGKKQAPNFSGGMSAPSGGPLDSLAMKSFGGV